MRGTRLETPVRELYRVITAQKDIGNIYDQQTTAVMRRVLASGSNCIDVGCHQGAVLDEMLRLAPEGVHYAFEPLPDFYSALQRKYSGAANVHLYEAALSDKTGCVSFQHVVTNPAYSGLQRRRYDRPQEQLEEILVDMLRLDDVIPASLQVHFLKIDVEGAELQVLRGAQETLHRCRPYVVFEHGLGGADMYGTHPEQVFDLLVACGLQVSLMGDWLTSGSHAPLSRDAFVEQFNTGRNYYFLAHP